MSFWCHAYTDGLWFWALNLTSALLVIATQALAVFLFSLFPALSIIISIVSMVGSLGATLGGVTFPVLHMFAPVYYASYLFPVRHFVEIGQNLLYGNYGYAYMWGQCSLSAVVPYSSFIVVTSFETLFNQSEI